jgi:non-ribosomal peptide synthetase component F
LKYAYFPLQRILAQHPNVLKSLFPDIFFVFHSIENQYIGNEVMIGDSRLHPMLMTIDISGDEIISKFDLALTVQCNQSINQLSCIINASLDLFDKEKTENIGQRFHSILQQLFNINGIQMKRSIYELSLTLPHEQSLMQSMNNTQVLFPPVSCIHHEFVRQAMKNPQKIAVELDDQYLTYSELLHYVQMISMNLFNQQRFVAGGVICLCVERSLTMVSY